ncbi:HET-domain-containing protein [Apiospora kogelbergensis]|uniref:HET-domain-containing protein n=1 Tax=Apiospora kogelbergensis TaxID=1337665 RepID=UPI00312F2599
MAQFTYQPLDATGRQIRLLDLLPSSGAVRCRLRHASLDAPERYESLSYSWGSPEMTVKILVNGLGFLVTPNLHTALQHLREDSTGRLRTLWVDAICINQSDMAEKEVQVPLMRDIYMSCQRTVIWLGRHDLFTKTALEAVEFMASRSGEEERLNFYEWRMVRRGGLKSGALGHIRYIADALHSAAAFNALFGRPWFTRIWVVQELALSPQAVAICGQYQIDWDLISRAHGRSKTNFEVPNHLGTLLRFRDWPANVPDDLMSHMLMAWHKGSQNAKDKIYGLMGLQTSHGADIQIRVDYVASDSEVFTRFTKTYLKITGNLQVLTICRGCKAVTAAAEDVLSWAIDPVYDKNREPLPDQLIGWSFESWHRYPRGFSAGGESKTCRPSFDGNLLGLQAIQLDTVTGVSFVNTPASAGIGDSNLCLGAGSASAMYGPTKQKKMDAFWQILRGRDPTCEEERARKESKDVDGVLIGLARPVAMGTYVALPILTAAYIYMLIMSGILGFTSYIEFFGRIGITKQRRLITTKDGYMGLAPRDTRVGDRILILQGYCAPIVARPGQRWRVVGDAYIHGIMEGEAFDETICRLLWFE